MKQLGSPWTNFHDVWYLRIFRKSVQKIQVSLKSDKNIGYFTWRPINIFIISRSFLLRIKNVSDKRCRENQNPHFVFGNIFFFEGRAVYEIMWKNTVERGRPQMTIWWLPITSWITKTADTHSGCVILIVFHCNNDCTNTPQSYIIRTLPLLLCHTSELIFSFSVRSWWIHYRKNIHLHLYTWHSHKKPRRFFILVFMSHSGDTSRQQLGWTLTDTVNTVKCSWWWAKTSPETCRAA
jgi:hypothetical protein